MNRVLFPLIAVIVTFSACVQPPEYPIEPAIEFVGFSKNTMLQGNGQQDQTTVTISFTDGDGDIGFFQEGNPNIQTDLYVRDSRLESTATQYTIPFVPELGSSNGISGEISFRLFTTCCIYPDWVPDQPDPCDTSAFYKIDTLQYEIYMLDRAGNESNRIFTEPMYLICN
jgi:hypothetical protein